MPSEIVFKDQFYSENELADLVGVSPRTIARWRDSENVTIAWPYIKIGRKTFYRKSTVERWIAFEEHCRKTRNWDFDPLDWFDGPNGTVVKISDGVQG